MMTITVGVDMRMIVGAITMLAIKTIVVSKGTDTTTETGVTSTPIMLPETIVVVALAEQIIVMNQSLTMIDVHLGADTAAKVAMTDMTVVDVLEMTDVATPTVTMLAEGVTRSMIAIERLVAGTEGGTMKVTMTELQETGAGENHARFVSGNTTLALTSMRDRSITRSMLQSSHRLS